jgi:hypothetical protein
MESLCLIEGDEVTHVFEKDTLSRAAYKHMCAWAITNFNPKLSVDELWVNAKEAWENLSDQNKMAIWSICNIEAQNARDIQMVSLQILSSIEERKLLKMRF